MTGLQTFLIVAAVGAAVILTALRLIIGTIPEGYEDATGFHRGPLPDGLTEQQDSLLQAAAEPHRGTVTSKITHSVHEGAMQHDAR